MLKLFKNMLYKCDKLSVIIPTLQTNMSILNLTVESLINDNTINEILIIDNSLKGLNYNNKKVKVITPTKNLYVNPSWNFGVKLAKCKYIALLNDDILLPENFCIQVLNFIKSNNICGLVRLESSTVINKTENDFETVPNSSKLKFKEILQIQDGANYYWGAAIFGKRDRFVEIPENMLIYGGDGYMMLQKLIRGYKNFAVYNATVKHVGSQTCGASEYTDIKSNDIKLYRKIKERVINDERYRGILS